MKTVRIRNTAVASDILTCKIYHTAINEDNLLSSSISSSGVFTGEDLYNGLTFQVDDNVSQFFVKNLTRCVNIGSGSLGENSTVVVFFTVGIDGNGSKGTMSIAGSYSTSVTSVNKTYRQNFSTDATVTFTANAIYPYEFTGWYDNSSFTGSPTSTSNPLTLVSGSFNSQTDWYAKFD